MRGEKDPENDEKGDQRVRKYMISALVATLLVGGTVLLVTGNANSPSQPTETRATKAEKKSEGYPTHDNILTTMFWAGEPPDESNHDITNTASAWVGNWTAEFGGIDNPNDRCGFRPCGFVPKENAFYFALPFNDYDNAGKLKPASVLKKIPWYDGPPPAGQSLVKNHWIAVTYKGKTVYGQWEDVGPFGENDQAYVFGSAMPKVAAGLDLSPAMNDYLHLNGQGKTSWQFVNESDVPAGPWKQKVTTSGLNY